MKLKGIFGKGSGKLGSSVFAISGGEQIVREYNPRVANPNTDAQVEQRAKLKLMSQLAAALAPGLAFKKMGLVSARNQFVAKNIGNADFDGGVAIIDRSALQLSSGTISMPAFDYGENNAISLIEADTIGLHKVVYISTDTDTFEKMRIVDMKIADSGADNKFTTLLTPGGDSAVVYAYGIIFNSASSKARYENYVASGASLSCSLETHIGKLLSDAITTLTGFREVE